MWSVIRNDDGSYNAAYKGAAFGEPKQNKDAAYEYALRLCNRYPSGLPDATASGHKRGGPYRVSFADGSNWTIAYPSINSIKAVRKYVCAELNRQRLPRGTKIERI